MQGSFAQVSLTDVLQLCILAKKSGLLKLTKGKENVDVYFARGEVMHAVSPLGEGERAFFYPLSWTEGHFVLSKDAPPPHKTVERSTSDLLAELTAVSQELEQIQSVIPTENSIFRIAEGETRHSSPITLSPEQWRVLSRTNGARSVKSIAEAVRLPYFDTAKIIYGLHGEGLVEIVPGTARPVAAAPSETGARPVIDPVPQGFFDRMVHGLAEVSGPIASVVVRDQIAALGATAEAFPKSRVTELVESVSQVIPDKRLKARFQQRMSEEIRALKAPQAASNNFTL